MKKNLIIVIVFTFFIFNMNVFAEETPMEIDNINKTEPTEVESDFKNFSRKPIFFKTGLQLINGLYYYVEPNGELYRGFKEIDGKTYFFSRIDGHMKLGWQEIDGNLYYFDLNRGNVQGLIETTNGIYYLENNKKVIGMKLIGDKTYFFSRIDGRMRTGLFDIDGYTYYFNSIGEMQTGLQKIGEYYYYFETDGKLYRGFKEIDGKTYFFSRIDGHMKLGWQNIDANRYYFDLLSGMAIGWKNVGGLEYYFNNNGTLKLGFFEKDGSTYYVDKNGLMATDWTVIEGRKFFFNSLGQLIAKDAQMIIDVSAHQKKIDWEAVKNSNMVDGVILRVGYGSFYEDTMLSYNISELKRLGIPYGIYIFSYAENPIEAIAEANGTFDVIKKYNINPTLGIYYDIEDWTLSNANSYSITPYMYQLIVENFIGTLRTYGYSSFVYTGVNFAKTRLNEATKQYIRWIAQYNHVCNYPGVYDMWQYSSTLKIPGISTNVDANVRFS